MRRGNHKTKHHIIPRSQFGDNSKDNISIVGNKFHQKYHSLFENRTPIEILDFLTEYFWKGNIEYVYQYLEKRRR
jgi:hypothetical protein